MNKRTPHVEGTLRQRRDDGLIRHLSQMGGRFCDSAAQSTKFDDFRRDEHVFQNLHWGLELLLKAFLHARGWTDARCIDEIGHDLEKSLAACEIAGLDVDPDSRSFLAELSRCSRSHRVAEFVDAGAGGWTTATAIEISRCLQAAIGRGLAGHLAADVDSQD